MASNGDPRHGIWILPLVIVAMVGATIIFVRALSPEDVSATSSTSTTIEAGSGSSTTSSTSSTLPTTTTVVDPVLEAYLLELDALEATATELVERAVQINADWDARDISFEAARTELQQLSDDTVVFVAAAEGATPVEIPELEPAHLDIVIAARAMDEAALAMIEGLLDPDSSAGRVAALAEYTAAGEDAVAAIDVVRVQAGVDPSGAGSDTADETGTGGATGDAGTDG